jgi:hypothetical protein
LSFNEDIFGIFLVSATVLATFSKIWPNFSESSGHPENKLDRFLFSKLPSKSILKKAALEFQRPILQ